MVRADSGFPRHFLAAAVHRLGAARREGAAAPAQFGDRGDDAGNLHQGRALRPRIGLQMRHAGDQAAGVGMLRIGQHLIDRRLLHLPAGIHDDDPLGHFRNRAHVVGNQDHGGIGLLLKLLQQVENLRLHGDVQRRRRLVGDQHLRLAGQRHRDHHALAHAAGQLVGILLDPLLRRRDTDRPQHLDGPVVRFPPAEALVQADGLADLVADRVDRVERGHRLLEDHRDIVAAHLAHPRLGRVEQVFAGKADGALGDPARRHRHQPHDGERRHALAAAGFADDAQRPARRQIEAQAVDHPRDRAVLEIEFDRQSLDLEQRAHRCLSFGLKASFRPSPIRLTDSTVMKMARPGKVTGHQASRICGRLTLIR